MNRGKFSLVFVSLLLICLAACAGGGGGSSVAADGTSGNDNGSATISTGGEGDGTLALAWGAPSSNTDGSPLTDLAGYKVHYGTASGNYTKTVDVGLVTGCSINSLSAGTYYITVTAYNGAGAESGYSNEVSKNVL